MTVESAQIPFWQDPKKRSIVFQIVAFVTAISFFVILYHYTRENLERQNIASGFSFLKQEAGFEISESFFDYWPEDNYATALLVGIFNTLKIAIIGNILAIILGVLVGIFTFSSNWLVSKLAYTYINILRNVPLLLQLFFWYALLTEIFPGVKQAHSFFDLIFISQRGINFPIPSSHFIWKWVFASLIGSGALYYWGHKFIISKEQVSGREFKFKKYFPLILIIIPLATWSFSGAPTAWDIPKLRGFNFSGGQSLSPEFLALMMGLVLYTGTYIAEIVRAGIQSVRKGQWEAGRALGFSDRQVMSLIILPQSLRVIIPPLTSQLLNLTKNSSLAVAIGYPDFVSVLNTTMNQTGQAIECVLMIMVVYLFFSLSTSLFMNWYNHKISLKER
jgi:general L-amino acid transport system permease protein